MSGAHVTEGDLPGNKRIVAETFVFAGQETTIVVVDRRKFRFPFEEIVAVGKFLAALKIQ